MSLRNLHRSRIEILSLKDSARRPLGEAKVPLFERHDVPIKYLQCPYSGSRYKHKLPMNVSPLPQMVSDWKSILGLAQMLIQNYRRFLDVPKSEGMTIRDLMFICELIAAIPVFVALVQHQSASPILSTVVSGGFKVAVGPRAAFRDLALQFSASRNLSIYDTVEGDLIYDLIEEKGYLIGQHEVCSGPNNMVQEIIEVLCNHESLLEAPADLLQELEIPFEDLLELASISNSLYLLEKFKLAISQKISYTRSGHSQLPHEELLFQQSLLKSVLKLKNRGLWAILPDWEPPQELLKELETLFVASLTSMSHQEILEFSSACESVFEALFFYVNPGCSQIETFASVFGESLLKADS